MVKIQPDPSAPHFSQLRTRIKQFILLHYSSNAKQPPFSTPADSSDRADTYSSTAEIPRAFREGAEEHHFDMGYTLWLYCC